MQYAVCCVSVSALRREPSHTSEMVSQQLFGECCTIDETIEGWMKITYKYDGYEGWCQSAHLIKINEEQFLSDKEKLAAGYINKVKCNGEKFYVPLGSSLVTFSKNKALWQNEVYIYKGKITHPSKQKINKKIIKHISKKFLNTPYLWGGKSVFGIDCSGFSQAVFKFLNIKLPRDSWQQALEGNVVDSLLQARCGDLCFFDNEQGKIIHVGILLNNHKIIHSSGKVRIDDIDEKGIINVDTQNRTHNLKLIKRFLP